MKYGKERRKNGKKEERGEGKGGKEEERTGRKGEREGRKEREEIKGIKIGKEEIKLSLLTDNISCRQKILRNPPKITRTNK